MKKLQKPKTLRVLCVVFRSLKKTRKSVCVFFTTVCNSSLTYTTYKPSHRSHTIIPLSNHHTIIILNSHNLRNICLYVYMCFCVGKRFLKEGQPRLPTKREVLFGTSAILLRVYSIRLILYLKSRRRRRSACVQKLFIKRRKRSSLFSPRRSQTRSSTPPLSSL